MNDPKKPPSSSTRTVAVIAVLVLIVVAIAGIVLASRQTGVSDAPVAPAAPVASAPLPMTTPAAASAPTGPADNTLIFAAGSDKLPPDATAKIARVAESARAGANSVRMTARFVTGQNKTRDQELAKRRTGAIHHALSADGMTGDRLQVELIEMPAGGLTEEAANRVELTLR